MWDSREQSGRHDASTASRRCSKILSRDSERHKREKKGRRKFLERKLAVPLMPRRTRVRLLPPAHQLHWVRRAFEGS